MPFLVRCEELFTFRAVHTEQVEYVVGMIIGGLAGAIIKGLSGQTYKELVDAGLSDANIRRLARGSSQNLDNVANAIRNSDEVLKAGKWFDDGATRGHWGREAELHVRAAYGGTGKRMDVEFLDPTNNNVLTSEARFIDSYTVSGKFAREVKTGDGKLTNFMRKQIAKDKALLAKGDLSDVEWNFFPSARGDKFGPDPTLIKELKDAGFRVVVWLP